MSEESSEERLSVLEAQVKLGLSLMDQGRMPEARQLLVEAIAGSLGMPVPGDDEKPIDPAGRVGPAGRGADFVGSLTEEELEGAFDSAEAERDEMIDADRVAQEVLSRDSVFATETVAGLLEQQGDVLGASEVREAIRTRDPRGEMGLGGVRMATLERWLDNLQKERA